MTPISCLFEDEDVLVELRVIQGIKNLFNSRDRRMKGYLDDPKIKRFVEMSQRVIRDEKLSSRESMEYQKLLKSKEVDQYLEDVEEDAINMGIISGSIIGGTAGMGVGGALGLGAAVSAGISGATVLIPIAALALLGAGAGGFSLGKLTGKLVGIFSKWKTRDMLRKQSAGLKRAPQREKPVRIGLGGIR